MAHDDSSEVQELEKALAAFHSGGGAGPAAAAPGAKVDICGTWHKIRPVVLAGIKFLNALPFGVGKKFAAVLQQLVDVLNAFCP